MIADGLGGPRTSSTHLGKIAVSDRGTLEGLTQSPRTTILHWRQPAEFKQHRGVVWEFIGVCATLFETARKSLILKRRDVRVVEGARLENEAGQPHQATSTSVNAHALSDLTFQNDH